MRIFVSVEEYCRVTGRVPLTYLVDPAPPFGATGAIAADPNPFPRFHLFRWEAP